MLEEKSLSPSVIPREVKDIALAIAEGQVKNAKMEWKSDGTVLFSADSPDGMSRVLLQKVEFAGVIEESKTNITKPRNVEERLDRVEVLRKRGMTQTEISRLTLTSQKTVSNDVKRLIEGGRLDG